MSGVMLLKPNIIDKDTNWRSLRKTKQVSRVLDQAANIASRKSTPNNSASPFSVIERMNDKL
jgi:hypothetical protein